MFKRIDGFLNDVEAALHRLGISDAEAWYRGHSKNSYRLIPSLLRISNPPPDLEGNLFADFNTRGAPFLPAPCPSWIQLAMMQHFGTPTRLLDWTESLFTALFFALDGVPNSPHVWITSPYCVNDRSTGFKGIYDALDRVPFAYWSAVNNGWPAKVPIAISPPWVRDNSRILRQRGSFTCHGSDSRPLDEQLPDCFARVDIQQGVIPEIAALLEMGAIDHYHLFPDLGGLSQSLVKARI